MERMDAPKGGGRHVHERWSYLEIHTAWQNVSWDFLGAQIGLTSSLRPAIKQKYTIIRGRVPRIRRPGPAATA